MNHDQHHYDHHQHSLRYDLVQTKVTFLMFFTVPAAIFVTSCLILFICSNVVRISFAFGLNLLKRDGFSFISFLVKLKDSVNDTKKKFVPIFPKRLKRSESNRLRLEFVGRGR